MYTWFILDHTVRIDKIKAKLENSAELKAEAVSKKLEHLQQQMDTYKGSIWLVVVIFIFSPHYLWVMDTFICSIKAC